MPSQPITADNAAASAELIRIVDAIDRAVDARDWERARGFFAATINADFSSLTGEPAGNVASAKVVDGWAAGLRGNKTSFHMATNHQVEIDEDAATLNCAGYA